VALIKSSQLVQKGTAVVSGDSIQTADVEALVPKAPGPTPQAPADQGSVGLGVDLGHVRGITGQPGGDPPADDYDATRELEAVVPALDPDQGPALSGSGDDAPLEPSLLGEFDAARDSLLGQAEAASQAAYEDAQQSYDPMLAQIVDSQRHEALSLIDAAYEPGSPEARAAIEAVSGRVDSAAQAIAHRNAIFDLNRSRWLQAGTAEEQIAALLDNFHAHLVEEPPLDDQFVALIAEREAILAEARLRAERQIQDAQAQAAAIVQEAERSAARTVIEVETRRQAILDELKQQGYSEGYQEGRAQADEEGAKIINEATDSLNCLAGALRESAKKNEEKLLKLAIGIAEKILHDEIVVRPDTVLKTLEEALMKVSDLEEVIIKVNPEDLPLIKSHEEAIRDRLKSVRKIEFTSNPKIQRGGVLIETGAGTVDAQIKTQLSVIQEAFDFVRKEYAEEPLDMTGSAS